MISVDFDKLEDINQLLKTDLNILNDILSKTKREAIRWNFKPQQELKCRSVRNLISDSLNFNKKCNNTISEMNYLINVIRQEINEYKNAEKQIVNSINKIEGFEIGGLKTQSVNISTSSIGEINNDNYDAQKDIIDKLFGVSFLPESLNGIGIGEASKANWWETFWDDTTPLSEYQILGHKIPVVPSTSDTIGAGISKITNNPLLNSDVVAYGASGLGLSMLGTVAGNSDRITDKPWAADSGNTNEQRLEKTGIQISGGAICYFTGKATSALAAAGFANIEDGAGIFMIAGAGIIDAGTSSAVTYGEDWIYKKLDIK